MNYAGCSRCGAITPLMCAGSFPPHMPLEVQFTPMPICGYCGPLPMVFRCMRCGTVQGLYMPGMSLPSPGWGAPQFVAPVVQASQGASQGSLRGDFRAVAVAAAKSGGAEIGEGMVDMFAAWVN